MVDKEQVSFTGTECGKIGTSFQAFQTQASACNSPVGSCLENQIKDLIDQDNILMSKGLPKKYSFQDTY